jgi:hypothetical protein
MEENPMARAAQSQGGSKWNPYSVGEMRKLIKDELEKLTTNDTYRNSKIGTQPFKQAKGQTNWNIYLYGELFERFTKRFDDTIRGTYMSTLQSLNATNATLNNLSHQLKNLEMNVQKYLKSSFENVLTNIVRNDTKFDEFNKNYQLKIANLEKLSEGTKTDIRKATKILKDNYIQEFTTFKEELSTTQEDYKNSLKDMEELLKSELANFSTNSTEAIDSVKATLTETKVDLDTKVDDLKAALVEDFGTKMDVLSENTSALTSELSVIKKDITEMINDKMSKHQETTNNVLEDQQKLTVADVHEKIKESIGDGRDHLESQAEKLAHKMEDINTALDSRMNEMAEQLNQKLQDFREEYDNNFNREMGELRTSISSIRADIEIMKTLLANLAK